MSETLLQRLAASLVSRPFVYELVQNLAGQGRVAERLAAVLSRLPSGRLLDVGSSEGSFARRLGREAVGLDVDVRALAAARSRGGYHTVVAADASRLPFGGGRFGITLFVAVAHHLDDGQLSAALEELARVTSGHFLLLDPLRNDRRAVSRWLWRYDRGRFPRTSEYLVNELSRDFEIVEMDQFAVYHEYLLCVAVPRRPARHSGTEVTASITRA
jgi:ubiquinone/menaquinone biosynthesis C-methylase UbiE